MIRKIRNRIGYDKILASYDYHSESWKCHYLFPSSSQPYYDCVYIFRGLLSVFGMFAV